MLAVQTAALFFAGRKVESATALARGLYVLTAKSQPPVIHTTGAALPLLTAVTTAAVTHHAPAVVQGAVVPLDRGVASLTKHIATGIGGTVVKVGGARWGCD